MLFLVEVVYNACLITLGVLAGLHYVGWQARGQETEWGKR